MNLLRGKAGADYVHTGEWAKKAIKAAKMFCNVNVVASAEDKSFTYAPAQADWKLNKDAAYVHYTANETIGGVEFHWIPETGDVPLVCDMSSNILSRVIDVSKFGLIYAGAQKNIGPAGLTIVIVRDDLIGKARADAARHAQLQDARRRRVDVQHAAHLCHLHRRAGLPVAQAQWRPRGDGAEEHREGQPALRLPGDPPTSTAIRSPQADRSRMNVPFTLKDAGLDEEFLKGAKAKGMVQLKGHRSVGGMRASIYNAMPVEGVKALVEYMKEFAASKG